MSYFTGFLLQIIMLFCMFWAMRRLGSLNKEIFKEMKENQ
ncbi:hypothetical protein Pan241w_04170 [Gimesia alba]|uniref:Uncharacterized protein n=1 Tax=Gimesia alba TaxID=2527973 RepID=A0A517R931_9PLAN|nr:hypothetical protein Pan241w_04170 [Gimesia alba]